MSKKSAVLTISIWDNQVRLSLIGKKMFVIDEATFEFSTSVGDFGVRFIDAFELVYFIRTGVQKMLNCQLVSIESIGLAIMPGYLMAWDRETCTPITPCLLPNNSLLSHQYQEFKFSSFSNLLGQIDQQSHIPNVALNAWVLSKQIKKPYPNGLIISGLDTWLNYLLSGYMDHGLVACPDIMSELTFSPSNWDEPLLKALGLHSGNFPPLGRIDDLVTRGFSPLEDGISIQFSTSMTVLVSNMMKQYTNDPIACIHLSEINHLYLENTDICSNGSRNHWIRFSSAQTFYRLFNLTNGHLVDVNMDDVNDDLVVPLDPFRSYHDQRYHMLNMNSFQPDRLKKLGVLQTLFLMKYVLSQYDHRSQSGHFQTLVFSASEWPMPSMQLCVDVCQMNGVDFKMKHWLDLMHVCQFVSQQQFFPHQDDKICLS